MWFENSYRRHLLDMHVNADDRHDFLSRFDPQEYLNNLLRADADSAMIYLQSHVGYCYFPTKAGHVHPAFADRPDAMKTLFDGCRKHGIRTVAYYSLIYNRVESIAHPDWRLSGDREEPTLFSGKRYLYCCPNSPGYLDFTLTQIQEMFSYAAFDGVFFDMPFWPAICRCPYCTARYEREHGGAVPADDTAEDFRAFAKIRDGWLNEFLEKITAYCKTLRPDVTVEYNLSSAALSGERMPSEIVPSLTDFASGDLYNGAMTHSFACKLYSAITRAQPFECMTSRCPNLKAHTLTRSRDALRISLLTVSAHHGANFVIDAIDPMGTMDRRFYEELGTLYAETNRYEPYMKTGSPAADVGLFYCLEGKYAKGKAPYLHYNATLGAAKTLTAAHIPYGVLTQATIDRLFLFRCVVIAGASELTERSVSALRAYVEGGGKLYFSGGADEKLLSLVAERTGQTESGYAYLAPCDGAENIFEGFTKEYPLPVAYDLPIVRTTHRVLAAVTLPYDVGASFASIHSDPPGRPTDLPAMIERKMGKGTVVWCAACLEAEKSRRITQVFTSVLDRLCGGFCLTTDAPEQVEAVAFRAEDETLVSFIYLTDDETVPRLSAFTTTVTCAHAVRSVTDLTTGRELPFTVSGEKVTFSVDLPDGFAMIRIH